MQKLKLIQTRQPFSAYDLRVVDVETGEELKLITKFVIEIFGDYPYPKVKYETMIPIEPGSNQVKFVRYFSKSKVKTKAVTEKKEALLVGIEINT